MKTAESLSLKRDRVNAALKIYREEGITSKEKLAKRVGLHRLTLTRYFQDLDILMPYDSSRNHPIRVCRELADYWLSVPWKKKKRIKK